MAYDPWTPGPWHYRTLDESIGGVDDKNDVMILQAQARPAPRLELAIRERQANAALAALAPEFVDAARGITATHLFGEAPGGYIAVSREAYDKLVALLERLPKMPTTEE